MPAGEHTDNPEQIAKDVDKFEKYEDLPLTEFGCDSYASWHKDFKKFSPVMESQDIVQHMHKLIPNNRWSDGNQFGQDVHLVITGGEPLLGWQRAWPAVINRCKLAGLQNITFETNGTQPQAMNSASS